MPTFEMDEAGKTAQVKSIFDSKHSAEGGINKAAILSHRIPSLLNSGTEDRMVDVEYLVDGGERIVTSYYQPGHEGCGRTGASCSTNEHASFWPHV